MTIVSKNFDIYMVSRFDRSISIIVFSLVGTYASIGLKVSHRVEIMYFFHILNFWILNYFFCDISSEVELWLVKTSIWMTPFRFESSWARDCEMWWIILYRNGGPYLVVGVRGILLPRVILRREGCHDHIWISIFFLWRQLRGGTMPLYGKSMCLWPYMGTPQRHRFLGCIKCVSPYYYSYLRTAISLNVVALLYVLYLKSVHLHYTLYRFNYWIYLHGKEITDIIVSHDIIIFVETKLDDLDILNVPNGYSYITKNRKKCVKNQVV